MSWFETLRHVEPLEDIRFDRALVDALEQQARVRPLGPMRFFTPTFRAYASDELAGCGKASYPDSQSPVRHVPSIAIIAEPKSSGQ